MEILPHLLVAYTTYLVGTISPGPANIAIMCTAMESGRRAGLAMAFGVISGSISWGILAALGFGAVLESYAPAAVALKVAGGGYLLWLATRAIRTARAQPPTISQATMNPATAPSGAGGDAGAQKKAAAHYLRGFGIHMTNPKAVFVWLAIISLGIPPEAPTLVALLIVAGCALLGVFVFTVYALAFSTASAVKGYARLRAPINSVAAILFGGAGLKLIYDAASSAIK